MTWIRLQKSHEFNKKKYPVGQVLNVSTPIAKEMVEEGKADYYKGQLPPKKMKTEFFKPKN
jgi:hypothetical protein